LALRPNAAISPHSNPNLTYLLVIEGGGWVAVGDERVRVSAGDAVLWPPNVVHAAWTELTPMRAIVVEFVVAAEEPRVVLIEDAAADAAPAGGLAQSPAADPPEDRSSPDGEPW